MEADAERGTNFNKYTSNWTHQKEMREHPLGLSHELTVRVTFTNSVDYNPPVQFTFDEDVFERTATPPFHYVEVIKRGHMRHQVRDHFGGPIAWSDTKEGAILARQYLHQRFKYPKGRERDREQYVDGDTEDAVLDFDG